MGLGFHSSSFVNHGNLATYGRIKFKVPPPLPKKAPQKSLSLVKTHTTSGEESDGKSKRVGNSFCDGYADRFPGTEAFGCNETEMNQRGASISFWVSCKVFQKR